MAGVEGTKMFCFGRALFYQKELPRRWGLSFEEAEELKN